MNAFEVSGGAVKKAKRRQKGADLGWTITVEPDTDGDLVITLPARACDATGAVCTAAGRALSAAVAATIPGPASVAMVSVVAARNADEPGDGGECRGLHAEPHGWHGGRADGRPECERGRRGARRDTADRGGLRRGHGDGRGQRRNRGRR